MIDDGIQSIRAELTRQIGAIEWRASPGEIAGQIDTIRRLAHRNRMLPVVTVAHLLESALARGERGAPVHGWLQMLRDAVASDRQDAATSELFGAAFHVRYQS